MTEWPQCDQDADYKFFFCAGTSAQPFAPTSVGDRGLVLFGPTWADDDEGRRFHAFVSTPKGHALLKYVGDYTKVTLPRENIEWSLLPKTVSPDLLRVGLMSHVTQCQEIWLKRLYISTTPAACTLRARVKLRDLLKREPSFAEVQGRLQDERVKGLRWRELSDAFKSGKEVRPGGTLLS